VLLAGGRRHRAARALPQCVALTSGVRVETGAVGRGRPAQAASSEQ